MMESNHYNRITAEPVSSKFASISRYMFMLMTRNFATSQWIFSKDDNGVRLRSMPGCVIASPSIPADRETDQDYVYFWVRDGALTVNECVYQDLPSNEMLNDYVHFSKLVQQNAAKAGKRAHACFKIDGTLRDWGEQGDGPALRILSILEIWDQLSNDVKLVAQSVLSEDQRYIIECHKHKTDNAWEEIYGYCFFASAAQRFALEQLNDLATKVGIPRNENVMAICDHLSERLDDYWDEELGHYRSILDGEPIEDGAPLRGHMLNCDLIFACTYAGMPCFDERMLRTIAKLREVFENIYPINEIDAKSDMGPSIGRYPGDCYDGIMDDDKNGVTHDDNNIGHPWPLCTASLARFYYQCMLELDARPSPSIVITEGMLPFFNQIGFTHTGEISKSSPRYKAVLGTLLTAGDKLMRAIVHHSDFLELSEQNSRYTGMCSSVRSLTWSYSSFMAASRTREMVVNAI